MKHVSSYWSATANEINIKPALQSNQITDVAIIGGGFTGLASAYYLGKAGVKSIVLESNRVGWGASGRNAGMLTTGFKKDIFSLVKKWGIEEAKKLNELSVECIQLVEEIVNDYKISCNYERCGSIKLAYKPKHFEKMKREQEYLYNNLNYTTTLVSKEQLKEEVNSPLYFGGLIDPKSHSFHPLNYAIGLSNIVEELGGKIFESTPVTGIRKKNEKFILTCSSGEEVIANHLIIATNGYTIELSKHLEESVIPIGSHIVTTEPLSSEIVKCIIPNNRVAMDTKNFLYYFRLTPDNRLLFGGRVSYDNKFSSITEENNQLYNALHKSIVSVFPQLKDCKIDYRWGGMTAFTLDWHPHIGQLDDGTHFALGYCGHGAAMSTLMGKYLAENIIGKSKITNLLESMPLKRVPFHSQRAKFLNIIGNYYKIRDAFF